MSRAFHFRLAALQRLRRVELDQAEAALAVANRLVLALGAQREAQLVRCRDADDADFGDATDLAALRARASSEAIALFALDAEIDRAVASLALARLAFEGARRKVKALERLEERRREEWVIEGLRHEANTLDELATGAYLRQSSGAAS